MGPDDDLGRPAWQDHAACRGLGAELFFPERGSGAAATVAKAKSTCAACPVRAACLDYGLALPHDQGRFGIWGGLTEKDRRQLRRSRRKTSEEAA
jgi:WhiB family redox-sensing transcriptional regulator